MRGEIAVLCYSRTGHSKRLAERLSRDLPARLFEMNASKYSGTVLGFLRAGFDSLRQKYTVEPQEFAPLTAFDCVILCGPVWTSHPAVPLRAVLRDHGQLPNAVALFLTSGGHVPSQEAFSTAEADLGRTFVATASLPNDFEDTEQEEAMIKEFLADLHASRITAA